MEGLRRIKEELISEKIKRTQEKEELKTLLKNFQDKEYQKHLIHKELGYVEEGEVMIQFPKKKKEGEE